MSAASTASSSASLPSSVTPSLTMARSLPHGVEELSQMSPFELFRSQMETGSTEAKVDAMKRLSVVALAMAGGGHHHHKGRHGGGGGGGEEDVLSTLVPYLANIAMKQPPHEDELLLLLASEMQSFVPRLLSKQQALPLLPILERLAAVEETVVRDQAVVALNHIIPQLQDVPSAPSTLLGLAKRLVGADWFTAKVSAAGILATIYQTISGNAPAAGAAAAAAPAAVVPGGEDLISLYKDLCTDETPMVRRSAAKHLGKFLNVVALPRDASPHSPQMLLLPALQQLCRDEQDSVRLLAVASLAHIGPAVGKNRPEWTSQHFLPIMKDGSTDMSWRVRHNLAKNFSDFAQNLGIQGLPKYSSEQSLVLACFASLLADVEAEVRAAAVGHLARMVHWGGANLYQTHLHPLIPALADDVVMEVRSKCALALMDAAAPPHQNTTLDDATIVSSFGPLLESFLQDEFHEVQLQVLTHLHKMTHLLQDMTGVVQVILNHMTKATNWRVRQGVAQLLPHLAKARGVDFFASVLLEPVWLVLLLDPVADVRMACVRGMPQLVQVTGQEWLAQNVLPHHVRIYSHANSSYLVRMTILRAHGALAVALASQSSTSSLWNDTVLQVLRGLTDKVANVRMVAARALCEMVPHGDPAVVQAQIRPALEKRITEEDDEDCRQACQMALDACR